MSAEIYPSARSALPIVKREVTIVVGMALVNAQSAWGNAQSLRWPSYGRNPGAASAAPCEHLSRMDSLCYVTTDLWQEERMLIDGELISASAGRVFENINPATEEIIGCVADGTAEDMDAAIGAARRAFDSTTWSTDVEFRVRCLRQLADALAGNAERLRSTLVAEVGSPVLLTYGPQLDSPLAGINWIADLVESYAWEHDLGNLAPFGAPSHRYIRREATGVVGAITPWNFPMQINLAKVIPALGAGNTVVLKPAPDTPWTATLLGRLVAEETDIPAGVFNVVTSQDHQVGAQLSADTRLISCRLQDPPLPGAAS